MLLAFSDILESYFLGENYQIRLQISPKKFSFETTFSKIATQNKRITTTTAIIQKGHFKQANRMFQSNFQPN